MIYPQKDILFLLKEYNKLKKDYLVLLGRFSNHQALLKNSKAQEYLCHGAQRRISTIKRCIDNIFKVYPPTRKRKMKTDKLKDIDINLHAFFINIAGCLDNLAWVFVLENDLYGNRSEGKLRRMDIGLFRERTKEKLDLKLSEYLSSDKINEWYESYCKNYRDALAHRIPLYVPPVELNDKEHKKYYQYEEQLCLPDVILNKNKYDIIAKKQRKLGKICAKFLHSLSEENNSILIHAQLIADFNTIKEIYMMFFKYLKI